VEVRELWADLDRTLVTDIAACAPWIGGIRRHHRPRRDLDADHHVAAPPSAPGCSILQFNDEVLDVTMPGLPLWARARTWFRWV
jgi:hypothetical protein